MSTKPISLTAYQLRLLAVLALINFVNFADRHVIAPLFPLLRQHFGVSDQQLGSLPTYLLVVLAIASLPLGLLADRFSQTKIIAAGVIFWSCATIASGLAPAFGYLLVARALVGVGEAAYAPPAQSMISDAFPQHQRAFAQSVFASGMILGGACGLALGGFMGELHGWQHAFFIIGIAGLVPGFAILRIPEPPRRPRSEVIPISRLLSVPAYVAMIVAGICITFSSVSLVVWGIDYANAYKDFSLKEAALSLALTAMFSLVFGVLAGGFIADRLQKRFAYGRIIAIMLGLLLSAPFVLLAIEADEKWMVLGGFFVAGFFMSWYHGPVTAVLHDLTPQRAHATAVGVYMFVTQLVGAIGPLLVGRISDMRDLQVGMQVAVAVMVGGALLLLVVIHFIRRDGLRHPHLERFRVEPGD